jgi:hypothetical protein
VVPGIARSEKHGEGVKRETAKELDIGRADTPTFTITIVFMHVSEVFEEYGVFNSLILHLLSIQYLIHYYH